MSQSELADLIVVGGGPAGLMAAEIASAAGLRVHVFDSMPSVGRKFLLAGIGGLNLTHADNFETFVHRYVARSSACRKWLERMGPQDVRGWAAGLGIETFIGSSNRVFPVDMKAAPLLRAWLHRLRHPHSGHPVAFHMRRRWTGNCRRIEDLWHLSFDTGHGLEQFRAPAVVFALGGGSWPKLGSDGSWLPWLRDIGVEVLPLRPANCGFEVSVRGRSGWSEFLVSRYAGQPLKNVELSFVDSAGKSFSRKGEFVLTARGIEGSLIYAASSLLRDEIARNGSASLVLDLKPDLASDKLAADLSRFRAGKSLTSLLKGKLGLSSAAVALLHELLDRETLANPLRLAARIKCLAITVIAPFPLAEAISSAGGVAIESLTEDLMLRSSPGLFCAGEMLDWEAPTGGYLLTACLASGKVAGEGVRKFLKVA